MGIPSLSCVWPERVDSFAKRHVTPVTRFTEADPMTGLSPCRFVATHQYTRFAVATKRAAPTRNGRSQAERGAPESLAAISVFGVWAPAREAVDASKEGEDSDMTEIGRITHVQA